MAPAAKGSRLITVGGERLRWWYRLSPCGCRDCPQDWAHILVTHESRKGAIVRAGIRPFTGPVTPSEVARIAQLALDGGWLPGHGTGEFHVPVRE